MATIVAVPSVYPPGSVPTIVDELIVDDGHVVDGVLGNQFGTPVAAHTSRQTVPVPSVYPWGWDFAPSITAGVISGDGHVVGGLRTSQFGQVAITVGTEVKPVGGVPSAQLFGIVSVTETIGGVPSAQLFGTVTIHTWIAITVPSCPSAALFGTAFIVFNVFLHDLDCLDEDLDPLLDSDLVLSPLDCLVESDVPICGPTICGTALCGGSLVYIRPLPTPAEEQLVPAGVLTIEMTPAGCK